MGQTFAKENWRDQPLDRKAAEFRAEFERRIARSDAHFDQANRSQSNLFNRENSNGLKRHAELVALIDLNILSLD